MCEVEAGVGQRLRIAKVYKAPVGCRRHGEAVDQVMAAGRRRTALQIWAGDFNVQHPMWSAQSTPRAVDQANRVADAANEGDIFLDSEAGSPTHDRGGSIDVGWASGSLLQRVGVVAAVEATGHCGSEDETLRMDVGTGARGKPASPGRYRWDRIKEAVTVTW